MTAVVGVTVACRALTQRDIRHVYSSRQEPRIAVRTQEDVGQCDQRHRYLVGFGQVQRHKRAVGARRTGSVHRRTDSEMGPIAGDVSLPPQGPAEANCLDETLGRGEWRQQAQGAPPAQDEVETRELPGEHGGVPTVFAEL